MILAILALAIIGLTNNIDAEFVLNFFRSTNMMNEIESIKTGVAQFNLSLEQVTKLMIPLPSISIQHEIVEKNNEEIEIVDKNKRQIEIIEHKVKDKISEVWGA